MPEYGPTSTIRAATLVSLLARLAGVALRIVAIAASAFWMLVFGVGTVAFGQAADHELGIVALAASLVVCVLAIASFRNRRLEAAGIAVSALLLLASIAVAHGGLS